MSPKTILSCPTAPQALGPYSQCVKEGNVLYISCQLPLDPQTGELSAPDTMGQTRQILENLKAITEFAGGAMHSVVKTTVYLTSLLDFDVMNEVYGEYFAFEPPARSTIEVSALPKSALVAIDAIVYLPQSTVATKPAF